METASRRNEPCPCGSGKRFKHCCGLQARETTAALTVGQVQALAGQALSAHQAGQTQLAEQLYRRVLAANPYHFDALHLLGVIRHQHGAFAEAEVLIRRALDLRPHIAIAQNNLGSVLQAQGRVDEAMGAFRRAVDYDPKDVFALNNLGNILSELQRDEEAIGYFRRAIKAKPTFAAAYNNLGSSYKDLGRWDDAAGQFLKAIELDPQLVDAHINLGNLRHLQGDFKAARAHALKAIEFDPRSTTAHFNLSLVMLTEGDFENGWREYEQRWATALHAVRPQFSQPYWAGEPLAGKTILLYAEQGLGDTLQFVRYAQVLSEMQATVVVTCQPELKELLRTVPGVAAVVTEAHELPEFDFYCPMMSLPRVLNTRLDSIPTNIPYLFPDAAKAAAWRERLPHDKTLKVGLVWAGNPRRSDPAAHRVDRRRSIALSKLAEFEDIPGITWISLQKGSPSAELASAPFPIIDWTDELQSFADTAALASGLDLVISVDTSVVHLLGGMGRPVWMLSRFDGCWRWLANRSDSPWYPSMRIFRQMQLGVWDDTIHELAEVLRAYPRPDNQS